MGAFIQQSYQREQLKATQKENERLNKQAWQSAAQQLNTVNLQRGVLRQQTGTDLLNINKEANRAASASTNNAAAAGIEGASVDEAVLDINRQNQEASATTRQNEMLQEVNLDTSVEDIVANAVSQQRYSIKAPSFLQGMGTAIGSTVGGFLDKYIGNSMDYGNFSINSGSSGSTASSSGGNAGTYFQSSNAQNQSFGSSSYNTSNSFFGS